MARQCAQQLRAAYAAPSVVEGKRMAQKVLAFLPTCPIPKIRRLGRTPRQWKDAFLAYFHAGRADNGGTDAISGLHRRISRGFHNPDNYDLRMLLIRGRLDRPEK